LRSPDSAQALVTASVTRAKTAMPAHPRTGQAAPAQRARALAPGVECLARQTDVMSVNPTCEPTLRISQLTDVLRCKLQECFQYRMHKTPLG
jgi:hypothetical protein